MILLGEVYGSQNTGSEVEDVFRQAPCPPCALRGLRGRASLKRGYHPARAARSRGPKDTQPKGVPGQAMKETPRAERQGRDSQGRGL